MAKTNNENQLQGVTGNCFSAFWSGGAKHLRLFSALKGFFM
jgi:hypothetical protein